MLADRDIRRILVIRRKGLGDALVTLPAVRQLAAAWPAASLDLVIDRPFAALIQDLVPEVTVLTWPPTGPGPFWPLRLRRMGYDLVIDYLGNPRTAFWTAVTGAPVRVGYDLPRRRWAYNVRVPRNRKGRRALVQFAGEAFLDPLRALGLRPEPWRAGGGRLATVPGGELAVPLGDAYRRWDAAWPPGERPRIALMFSASWPAKAWPAREGAALYRLLQEAGLDPVLVCGPQDAALAQELRAAAPEARFAPPTDLRELAHLLTRCRVFVGTDNGPRHLAAWLGVSTVTVFGPTSPRGWNPDDPQHVAVTRNVACSPCELTRCPIAGHPCLDDLPAATVATAVHDLLAAAPSWRPGSGKDTA